MSNILVSPLIHIKISNLPKLIHKQVEMQKIQSRSAEACVTCRTLPCLQGSVCAADHHFMVHSSHRQSCVQSDMSLGLVTLEGLCRDCLVLWTALKLSIIFLFCFSAHSCHSEKRTVPSVLEKTQQN